AGSPGHCPNSAQKMATLRHDNHPFTQSISKAMIVINVTFVAKPGCVDAFRTLMLEAMAGSRGEDGCIEYRYSADLSNPDTFYLLEMWRDEGAFKGHLKGTPFANFIGRVGQLADIPGSERYIGELSTYQIPSGA